MLRLTVDPDGCPVGAVVESGPGELTQAATSAIFQWQFRPTMAKGQAVWVDTTMSFTFSFTGEPTTPPDNGRIVVRLKSGYTIAADAVREVDDKLEITKGEGTYVIGRKLVQDVTLPKDTPMPLSVLPAMPPGAILVTPETASPPPPSLAGNWSPYESTENIRKTCIHEPFDPESPDPRLSPNNCAVWNIDMGADYETLVDRGIQLKRNICSNPIHIPPRREGETLQDKSARIELQLQDVKRWADLAAIRGELIKRQSTRRFDRVHSTRIIIDYNRLLVSCP